jgi:hypothetical protein
VVRRNPAFRIATGGLTVAVLLCLVGAISLLNSTPPAEVAGVSRDASPTAALQVATTGEVSHLLDEHPHKPVPEPLDPQTPTSLDDDRPGPWMPRPEGDIPQYVELPPPPESEPDSWTDHSATSAALAPAPLTDLESELSTLQGVVSELTRTQLEAQLAEIRHAEQLLSAHQTNRMIEALQRDVDELKAQRIGVTPARETIPDEGESELVSPSATHHDEGPLDHSASTPTADVTPSVTTDVPRDPASTSTTRVRFAETPNMAGRFDVDADEAPLHEFLTKLGPVAGWNLVCGPEMQGTVHCRWKGVELKPALNQLLKVHNWQVREEGDFAIVEPQPRPASALQTDEHSGSSITLDLAPDPSAQRPWNDEPENDTFNTPTPRQSVTSQPPFRTDSRQISFGSGGRATPRRGRIVMADYPELMSQRTPPDLSQADAPQWVEIEATILEIRQAAGGPRGVFRRTLSVAGQGSCPLCGVVHDGPVGQVGHSVAGWFELEDGIQAGVCPMTPDLITATLQKHSTTTVSATPRVNILSRQLAEIALTEQPGYRRHLVREKPESDEVQLLPGVKITLRPTAGENGLIRLDLRPSSVTSEEFSASLSVPPSSCVVLGGLDFVREPATPPAAEDLYEVVVLIQVRPRENSRLSPLETPATRPPRYAAPSSLIEPPR